MLGIWVETTQGLPISRCMCYFWNGGSKQGRQKHSPRRVSELMWLSGVKSGYQPQRWRSRRLHHVTTTLSEFPTACCFWPLATNVLATSWDFCARRSNFFCDCCNLSRWVFRSNLGHSDRSLEQKSFREWRWRSRNKTLSPKRYCIIMIQDVCIIHCIQIVHSI